MRANASVVNATVTEANETLSPEGTNN